MLHIIRPEGPITLKVSGDVQFSQLQLLSKREG